MFMVKLYGFCLSIAYTAHQRHPYIESVLINQFHNCFSVFIIQAAFKLAGLDI